MTASKSRAARRLVRFLAVCVAASSLVGACSPDEEEEASKPAATRSGPGCATPASSEGHAERVPDVFTFDGEAEVIGVTEDQQGYSAKLQVPMSLEAAYDRYHDDLPGAGYDILGDEFDGSDAEVYFDTSKGQGFIQLRQIDCEGVISSYVKVMGEKLP